MKIKRVILVILIIAVLMAIGWLVYLGLSSERVSAQRVQRTLDRREKAMDRATQKVSFLLENENLSFESFAAEFDDDPLVFVFCDDSLMVWTSNLVDPKFLKDRILLDADTVCNLYVGDFLVRSFQKNDYSVYLLSLLNTTYSIENGYLINEFNASVFPKSTRVIFSDDGKYPLYNASGCVTSRYDIVTHRDFSFTNQYLVYIPVLILIVLLVLFVHYLFTRRGKFDSSRFNLGEFTFVCILLAFAAVVLTYIYDKKAQYKEERLMKQVAADLFDERDNDFEKSFSVFSQKMTSDTLLLKMVFSENSVINDVVAGYARNLLFDSVLQGYEVVMTVCAPGEDIFVDGDESVPCDDYFNDVISRNSSEKISDELYFIDYATLDPNYLGVLTLSLDSTAVRNIYFEFYKPVTPNGFGLPRILQTSNSLIPSDFSVASYRNNMLNYKYGSYIYPNHLKDFRFSENSFYYSPKMKHYTLVEDNKALVISCQQHGWVELTAPFAVFFVALVLIYLPFYYFLRRKNDDAVPHKSLRRRFQVAVMLTMLIAFGIVGPVSVVYMLGLYNQKAQEFNFEQTRSVLLDLRREMDYRLLTPDSDPGELELLLRQFSNTFFVDLNLFDTDGYLIATSRPELFDYRLQAPLINAQAFANLNDDKSLYFSHIEYVGKNKFQSNYIAVVGVNGETAAYLNIPYFSTDEDVRKEVINFALAYTNIILLLIGISAIVVMIIMQRMTKPLALIQKKMSEVRLGSDNKPIEWESHDEIGELVEQYNVLVAELEKSANYLVRSERETAWREMARQVAHEIKNPLTPMRLSIQFLQRAWDEQSPDMEQRLKRTTSTLIEQIDTLSDIASAFSNYAKLPEGNPEPLDLRQIVTKCVDLYNIEENIRFDFVCDENQEYPFTADSNNLSRAFGNIIKNAIQAIGKSKLDGHIEVGLRALPQKYVVTISDNGKGIKEEDKAKIFLPNFTTKSSGMGIGLSIVHNIIQAANGRISFESTENVGTTFTIELFKSTSAK